MPKDETPSKVDERLKEVRDRYRMARDGWRPIYDKAKEDIEFVYDIGEGQWPSSIRTKRENAKRPVITINKLLKFARQVRGQSQQNKPRVKVIPVDNNTDPQIAELYDGLIRKIEYLSDASNAYDTAYAHSLTGGVGFWRIITQWCEDNPFNQELWIRRIIDPFSVHLDPAAKSFNYEDARYCFVEESISKDEYERQYPDSDLASFEGTLMEKDHWYSEDRVRVAEYFWKEHYTVDMGLLDDGSVVQLGKDSEKRIANDGLTIVSRRTVDKHRVRWMKTNGFEILKEGEWPGKYIPIIPVFGEEIVFGGGKEYLSLFRGAKDPQRMYNYWADLSIKTSICTPLGWEPLENIHVGDFVFDEKGKPCRVVGESPILNKEKSYKITFSDGSVIVASADHLWKVNRGSECDTVVQTREIDVGNDSISLTEPLELPERDVKITPYTLGLWLSDGNSRYPEVFAHKKTVDELAGHLVADGCVLSSKRIMCKETETYSLYMRGVRKHFVHYGLFNNKHIPKDYLRASYQQRLELLRGLMDGDGSCRGGHQVGFAVKSVRLAEDFSELLYSLGLKGNYKQDKDGINHFYFTAYAPIFKLGYKLTRQMEERDRREKQTCRYKIVSIEEIDGVPTKCITVDSPSHLFLAGRSMVPTHNTAGTEAVALAPKSPFIVDHRQIDGFESEWEEANEENRMYIRYNAIAGLNKPTREPQTQIPVAIMTMMQSTAHDIEDHLGRYDASKGAPSNERSGRAILARVEQSDRGSYVFVDNLTRAVVYCGRQLIDLIPKIYDSQRAIRVMDETGQDHSYAVNTPAVGKDGKQYTINDLSVGKYDVIASVGSSYASKRTEMVEMMVESMQYAPQLAHVIAPLIFKYADFPGAQEVYGEMQKAIEAMQAQEKPVQ